MSDEFDVDEEALVRGDMERYETEEHYEEIGKDTLFITDKEVIKLLDKYDFLEPFKFVFSHLMELANIDKRTATDLIHKFRVAKQLTKMKIPEDKITIDYVRLLDMLEMLFIARVHSAIGGWKGRLYKITGRTYRIEREPERRGWSLFR